MELAANCTIIFVDVPPKTFVGINLASFNSSPNFHGISGLLPGLYFVYTGTDASLSIRHGRWLRVHQPLKEPPAYVLQWNRDLENLSLLQPEHETVKRVTASLPALVNRGLIDYSALVNASSKLRGEQSRSVSHEALSDDIDQHVLWSSLINHVSGRLLNRLLSHHEEVGEGDGSLTTWELSSISSAPNDIEHIPGLSRRETESTLSPLATLDLTPLDLKQTWPESAVGRERTDKARDRSWYLNHVLEWLSAGSNASTEVDKQTAARELLGELQFCFVMVLTLANYSCLEQWRRILSVLLTCKSALSEVEDYFVQIVKVLSNQLDRLEDVEGGLFELRDEQSSAWLRRLLKTFQRNADDVFGEKPSVLRTTIAELEDLLRDRYGWEDDRNVLRKGMMQLEDGEMIEMQMAGMDEDEETGEYAPTIVDL